LGGALSAGTQIALAVVGVALVATVLVNGVNASKVVSSVSQGFGNSLSAAEKG
jgi:hypothetical protein